jgi:hypothetical protein
MQWVWYRRPAQFPVEDLQFGRWLGVAQDVGQAMTYWVLTHKGTVVARSSVTPLSSDDLLDETLEHRKSAFMAACTFQDEVGDKSTGPIEVFPDLVDDDPVHMTHEADDFTPEAYNKYLCAQVILPIGGELRRGEVIRRKRDHEGRPIGVRNTNPLLDTR